MKYIKMNIVRNNIICDWWCRINEPLFKNVLFVNENKAPKRHFRIKRGGHT